MTEVIGLPLTPNSWESLPSPQHGCSQAPLSVPHTHEEATPSPLNGSAVQGWAGTKAPESATVSFLVPSHRGKAGL